MANAIFYCSFRLRKGASVPDFLLASENLNNDYISRQPGYISWKQLVDGDTWADFIMFETMADVKAFETDSVNAGALAEKFYSFIDLNSCKLNHFSVEKSYEQVV